MDDKHADEERGSMNWDDKSGIVMMVLMVIIVLAITVGPVIWDATH